MKNLQFMCMLQLQLLVILSIDTKMPAVYFVDVSQQLLNNAAIMSYSRKELDFY